MVPTMTTAALTRASRGQLFATRPKVVMAPLEGRLPQSRWGRPSPTAARSRRRGTERLVDHEAHVTGLVPMFPPSGTPGDLLDSGNESAATT